MRQNPPVSDHGTPMVEDQAVVSKTDMDGNIVYVHPDFCDASGDGAEEQVGAPRDILRHPDMAGAARGRGEAVGAAMARVAPAWRGQGPGFERAILAAGHMDEATQAVSLFQFGRARAMPGPARPRPRI